MARTLIVMVLLFVGFPAKADQCDHIVANLIAQTPGLQLDKRMPAEGADIVYLKHPQVIALSIFCPVPSAASFTLSVIGSRTLRHQPIFSSLESSAAF